MSNKYCNSTTQYSRRKTREVNIGGIGLGGDNPIRVQSMTTIDTMDTIGSVDQTIRIVESGAEYVRITAPSLKEAKNLENIKKELRIRGYQVPLIADIHFTPNAAELAARLVEKVRINPGNYADKKKFAKIEYTNASYQEEIARIRERFIPLIKICKEYGTAMRIGTNHGSLSDRIMNRYGDTPMGMVESALEFLRVCEECNYYDIVLSMKSSNTLAMVQAYRLLVQKMEEEKLQPYPLHLGVTEAGEGEDGRIKSAVGVGTLLEDGLGDTVRISLTEDPEFEPPIAQMLIDRYAHRQHHTSITDAKHFPIDPFSYHKRETREVENIGGSNVPRVIADITTLSEYHCQDLKSVGHFYLPEPDKWKMNDQGVDYVYTSNDLIPYMLPNGLKQILDANTWIQQQDQTNNYPLFSLAEYSEITSRHATLNFLRVKDADWSETLLEILKKDHTLVLLLSTDHEHAMPTLRAFFFELMTNQIQTPVMGWITYQNLPKETFQLYASTDVGGLLIDGLGDGVLLDYSIGEKSKQKVLTKLKTINQTAFGILQAARTRISKTEYISCPSCGRTLFDLQETTAMIRKRTDHLKGIKIGIMGCIVNGPGEMADADYGYVGSGKDKITLYKGQEIVERGVHTAEAVDKLIQIIKDDGNWVGIESGQTCH